MNLIERIEREPTAADRAAFLARVFPEDVGRRSAG
jgi:hypothetical protein